MNGAGRNGPGRNGTLSPISTVSSDSNFVSKYQQLGADNPYSPGLNSAYSTSPLASPPPSNDGRMSNAMKQRTGSNGNPSPPSSVARSSDGTGLYSNMSTEGRRERVARLEARLQEHYIVLKKYLSSGLRGDNGIRPNKARDKLLRLSMGQFEELSTDVFDELRRREDMRIGQVKNVPRFLLPIKDFHPKRNQARQKLSTLPPDRFRQLVTDVFFELERRFPRFSGRPGSPALSIASSRGGPPNMGSMPPPRAPSRGPPPSYRGTPPPPSSIPGMSSPEDEFGKPLPKQFQQNTIVPNKSTMVEDDSGDEEGGDELYDLSRMSKRSVAPSGASSEYQTQITQLESKVDELEAKLREKDEEMENLRISHTDKEIAAQGERDEWQDARNGMERKLADAQNLNNSIQDELQRLRVDNENMERDLREATQSQIQDGSDDGEWQQRYETLQQELYEQEQVTREVQKEAKQYLAEMRTLSEQSSDAMEHESQLIDQVHTLEAEVKDWKTRYAKARTQLRSIRTSSMGLSQPLDAGNLTRDNALASPSGLIKDVHLTRFQISIDELLQAGRNSQASKVTDAMKSVIMSTRSITSDCDAAGIMTPPPTSTSSRLITSPSPPSAGIEPTTNPAKLKSRVSATANNLITASKNHAAADGLSPVSLLDAAASHLTMAVVQLVRVCRIRPTPAEELADDFIGQDAKPLPKTPATFSDFGFSPTNGMRNGGMGMGKRESEESASYSAASGSSPRRGAGSSAWHSRMNSLRSSGRGVEEGDVGLVELKAYIDNQTAHLVRAIQPLVQSIRSASSSPSLSSIDLATIQDHVADISSTVEDIVHKTSDSMRELDNPVLDKFASPVIGVLEECRAGLLDASEERDGVRGRVPGLAFKIARATKELVLRVDRIESGELTERDEVSNEF
ncbi:MAG: component of the polarisome [Bogoriella megaspora]|nr:MAG: component of the polarisome [Bogoriella megaspora]